MEASRPLTLRVRTSACVFLVFGHLGTTKVSLTNDECKKLIVEMTILGKLRLCFKAGVFSHAAALLLRKKRVQLSVCASESQQF